MNTLKNYLILIRPAHWIKNLLIFAPLVFASAHLDIKIFLEGIPVFFAFSLLASSVYVINDCFDKESDRLHPVKKLRPIASGKVDLIEAYLLTGILFISAILLSIDFNVKIQIFMGLYFIINLLYSKTLKHIVILDLFIIATLYLIRIFIGGEIWQIELSHWIILCTFFLALFLISGKRRAELNNPINGKKTTRLVIQNYNEEFLNHLLTISTTAVIVTYSLYTTSTSKPLMIYSAIIVAFGLFRYLYLIYNNNIGEAPEQTLFKDTWIVGLFMFWLLYISYIFLKF